MIFQLFIVFTTFVTPILSPTVIPKISETVTSFVNDNGKNVKEKTYVLSYEKTVINLDETPFSMVLPTQSYFATSFIIFLFDPLYSITIPFCLLFTFGFLSLCFYKKPQLKLNPDYKEDNIQQLSSDTPDIL